MIMTYLHSTAGALALLFAIWVWTQLRLGNPVGTRRARWGGWLIALLVWLGAIGGGITQLRIPLEELNLVAAADLPWLNTLALAVKKPLAVILLLVASYLPVLLRSVRLREMDEAGRLVRTVMVILMVLLVVVVGMGVLVAQGHKLALPGEVL